MDDDRLRRELDLAADGIDAGDTIGALGGVRATTRRRRFRRTGIGALGAATNRSAARRRPPPNRTP